MKKLVLSLLQILFVNGLLIFSFLYYNDLPRYLTVIFFYFVLPILFWVAVRFVWERIDSSGSFQDEDIMPGLIASITIWIATLVGSVTSVQDFFLLKRHGQLKVQSISEIPNVVQAAYLRIEKAKLRPNLIGYLGYSSKTKSGDSYTVTRYDYRTLACEKNEEGQHALFVGFYRSNDTERINSELKQYRQASERMVQGLIVRDPYEKEYFRKTVKNGAQKFDYTVAEDYLVIQPKESFEEIISKYRLYAIIFFSVVNLLWCVLPIIWIIR